MIKAFVIIPAKGDSKRLVGKNKRIIAGKTLLAHSIEYALKSELAEAVLVSTEDEDLRNIADPDGTRNGSIRITKAEHVKSGYMSRRVGSMTDECTNIHSEQDLKNAESNINERLH